MVAAQARMMGSYGGPLLILLLTSLLTAPPSCRAQGDAREVKGVKNICASDERPMSASAKRLSCKEDAQCKHETQCGCIPKWCTCGDEPCWARSGDDADPAPSSSTTSTTTTTSSSSSSSSSSLHESEKKHMHDDGEEHSHEGGDSPHDHGPDQSMIPVADADDGAAGSLAGAPVGATTSASKHDLVDDDGDGPAHTHADGTTHGHPGGEMPHHHDGSGGIVFDVPKKPAKLVMNKGKLLLKPSEEGLPAEDKGDDAVDADQVHDEDEHDRGQQHSQDSGEEHTHEHSDSPHTHGAGGEPIPVGAASVNAADITPHGSTSKQVSEVSALTDSTKIAQEASLLPTREGENLRKDSPLMGSNNVTATANGSVPSDSAKNKVVSCFLSAFHACIRCGCMGPHTTVDVLILLHMCPHPCMCPHTTVQFVSTYLCLCECVTMRCSMHVSLSLA